MVVSGTSLMLDITNILSEKYGIKETNARQLNAIISASNQIAQSMNTPHQAASPNMGIAAWLGSDETGRSSKFMAKHLKYDDIVTATYAVPHDCADFCRCLNLLESCPELKPLLGNMKTASAEWARLVLEWNNISDFISDEKHDEAYNLIQECLA